MEHPGYLTDIQVTTNSFHQNHLECYQFKDPVGCYIECQVHQNAIDCNKADSRIGKIILRIRQCCASVFLFHWKTNCFWFSLLSIWNNTFIESVITYLNKSVAAYFIDLFWWRPYTQQSESVRTRLHCVGKHHHLLWPIWLSQTANRWRHRNALVWEELLSLSSSMVFFRQGLMRRDVGELDFPMVMELIRSPCPQQKKNNGGQVLVLNQIKWNEFNCCNK